ncbi:MAG: TIGR00730 family Rossman fold protein [Bacteroidetes bacterium]|nr:MAG: TIGR00730 family Rossman fold protein [Bacteroidota bacterium]RLD49483.1 MAG: TIGR00730 family Rossman fold protein [Bacteroidota bacterium]RLD87636.1 MAG: TIGR00730 family Rossman fold protein [Bacteroidota bacterium]
MAKICVFCGSSMGARDEYKTAARDLANYLAAHHMELVYGGADVGLMKVLSDTALAQGVDVIGVMPKRLIEKEVAHHKLTEMIVVETMAERKDKMVELSDGFVALPGGFGTFDELSEILTFNQLRISDKPLGILNIAGYFDDLLKFYDHAVAEGFVRKEHRQNLIVSDNIPDLMRQMNRYQPLTMGKWIEDIKNESNHL